MIDKINLFTNIYNTDYNYSIHNYLYKHVSFNDFFLDPYKALSIDYKISNTKIISILVNNIGEFKCAIK